MLSLSQKHNAKSRESLRTGGHCSPTTEPNSTTRGKAQQARFWIATIREGDWVPELPTGIAYVRGQLEQGDSTGFRHWQLIAYTKSKKTRKQIKQLFGDIGHWEPTRSKAAEDYV